MSCELLSLVIGYPSHEVAGPINVVLREGELCCLLGANGAGKSTLLRTLATFQPPLSGEMRLNDRPIEDYSPHELSTLIGIVLTERLRTPGITVRDMVAMGRSPYTNFWGRLTEEDQKEIDKAISLVGIEALSARQIATLSDGERQKVMIAKALAQQTPIVLLDEPTAFLDFPSKVEIMLLLGRLAHEMGKTVLISTHDLDLALQTAYRLWLMGRSEGLRIKGEGLRIKGEGLRIKGEGLRIKGEGLRVKGEGLRIKDEGLKVKDCFFAEGTPRELADELPRFFPSEHLTFDASTLRFNIKL